MVISLSPRVVKSTGDNFPDGGGNHLVFFLLDLAAELDLEAIHAVYRHARCQLRRRFASIT
jgi:hypothetical protein